MDHAQPSGIAIEKDTLAASIARDVPGRLTRWRGGRDEQRPLDIVSSYCSRAYDFDDDRFDRDTPTLAARSGMVTPVPSVNIQTKRWHIRIISRLTTRTQSVPP